MKDELTREIRNKAFLVFMIGLFSRLVLMMYTQHAGTWEELVTSNLLFSYGWPLRPLIELISFHTGFYIFFWPIHIPYKFLNIFGIYYEFLVMFLGRVPALIGDILTFYSLHEISLLILKDRRKSLFIASVFFLNPYSIFQTSVIGQVEPLITAFVLLSFLYLLRGSINRSAFCLAFSASIRILPVFLLPAFLAYLRKSSHTELENQIKNRLRWIHVLLSQRMLHFLGAFSVSLFILFSPYLIAFVRLYSYNPRLSWYWISLFTSPVSADVGYQTTGGLVGWVFNFTSIINTLGLAEYFSHFMGYRPLLFVYLACGAVVWIRSRGSSFSRDTHAHLLNRLITLFYSLFMILIPLAQGHYLAWFLPFLILESQLFHGLPSYYPIAVSALFLLIEPIAGLNFVWYFLGTFPGLFSYPETQSAVLALRSDELLFSISGVLGLFFILTIVMCLKDYNRSNERTEESYRFSRLPEYIYLSLFSVYCGLEMLGIVWGGMFKSVLLHIMGLLILTLLLSYIFKNRVLIKNNQLLLQDQWSKVMAFIHILSLGGIFIILRLIQFDSSIVLIIQISILASLWILNRRFPFSHNLQLFLFIFTSIYVFYALLATKDVSMGYIVIPYLLSWVYLQAEVDRENQQS